MEEGVSPSSILVVTFTKYAAAQMRSRLQRLLPQLWEQIPMGTFHRIFFGILRESFGVEIAHLLSEKEKEALLRQAVTETAGALHDKEKADVLREFIQAVGKIKSETVTKKELSAWRIGDISVEAVYTRYEKLRLQARKIDYDDMILLCRRLLTEHPDVRRRWQERFSHIMIDEFQDINKPQFDTICLLLTKERNLFVVGDDDQAIYGFRGADVSLMLDFPRYFPGSIRVMLDENYRSVEAIVGASRRMIEKNRHRFAKKLRPAVHSAKEKASRDGIAVIEPDDVFSQSAHVYRCIMEEHAVGRPFSQIAVLYRTHAGGSLLVSYLSACGIPFVTKDRFPDIHDHFVYQDMLAYMQLADPSPAGRRRHMLRVMNRPNRYIKRESLAGASEGVGSSDSMGRSALLESVRRYYFDADWMQERIDELEEDLDVIASLPPGQAVGYIRKAVGYDLYLRSLTDAGRFRPDEEMDLLTDIARSAQEEAERFPDWRSWLAYMEAEKEKAARNAKASCDSENAVQIMSMHSAKGLEFDTVVVLDVTEGSIPYHRARTVREAEEERRLFYVAMTRARRRLILSVIKNKNGKRQKPSRFIKDMF